MLGVHLGAKISGTYNVAVTAIKEADENYHIRLIDTETTMMEAGLLTIEAAQRAEAGMELGELENHIRDLLLKAHTLCILDNARYLGRGGHTSKNFKERFTPKIEGVPLVEIKGEIKPYGKRENRSSAIMTLFQYVENYSPMRSLAVEYAVDRSEAELVAT